MAVVCVNYQVFLLFAVLVSGSQVAATSTPVPLPPYMVFASKNAIYRVDLNGADLRIIENQSYSIAIDYDIRRNYLFWTDVLSRRIMWANLDGSQPRILVDTGLNITDGLAWDWLNQMLYWTDTDRKIEVYDINSGHRKKLIETGQDSIPRGIVLDPNTGYMYWTDWGNPAKIERASMDGTSRQTLHNTSLVWPNDITIDYQSQTIYWIDASLDKLESSHVTGSNRRFLSSEGILHPFSITFYRGILYWSDWGYKRVVFGSLSDLRNLLGLVPELTHDPTGVKVVALDAQPISSLNPCSMGNGGCSHLCLLTVSGHSCNCPIGLELADDNTNCEGASPTIVTITGSPVDTEYFTGLQLNLTCSIHIPPEFSSSPVMVSTHWSKSGLTPLLSSGRVIVGEGPVRAGPRVYQTSLVFTSLDGARGDEGNYTCSASIALSGVTVSTASATSIVQIPTTFFQLRLSGVSDCLSWRSSATSAKDRDLVDAIIDNMIPRCGCDFRVDRITDRAFHCFPSSPQTVTYHAQLHGTLHADVSRLLASLQEWSSSGVAVAVQFLPLSVESFCEVDSSSSEECPTNMITTVIASTMAMTVLSSNTTDSELVPDARITTPATVASVVVVVILIAFIVLIVVAILLFRRRRSNLDHVIPKTQRAGIMEENTTCTLALEVDASHDYEEIGKYCKKAVNPEPTLDNSYKLEFSISQCAAYEFTPKSARPELVYEEVQMQGRPMLLTNMGGLDVSDDREGQELGAGRAGSEVNVEAQYETMNSA